MLNAFFDRKVAAREFDGHLVRVSHSQQLEGAQRKHLTRAFLKAYNLHYHKFSQEAKARSSDLKSGNETVLHYFIMSCIRFAEKELGESVNTVILENQAIKMGKGLSSFMVSIESLSSLKFRIPDTMHRDILHLNETIARIVKKESGQGGMRRRIVSLSRNAGPDARSLLEQMASMF